MLFDSCRVLIMNIMFKFIQKLVTEVYSGICIFKETLSYHSVPSRPCPIMEIGGGVGHILRETSLHVHSSEGSKRVSIPNIALGNDLKLSRSSL